MSQSGHDAHAHTELPTVEWCRDHFDHTSPDVAQHLADTLTQMREHCPVTHSDQFGGFWVVTKYDDVMNVAQDWESFSSKFGVGVPKRQLGITPLPEISDPPLQRFYKRTISPFFTPQAVLKHEAYIERLVHRLIDDVVEAGECEFMEAFARPFPGETLFEAFLNAPAEDAALLNGLAMDAVRPTNPNPAETFGKMRQWIDDFVAFRRAEAAAGAPAHNDVIDAIVNADIDGRPINEEEIVGLVLLLILGGLDTTAGALGQIMVRLCTNPEIPEMIRNRPEALNEIVEELLRLDGPFVSVARETMQPADIGGCPIATGDRVLFYWASANRDEAEFDDPHTFNPDRESNRHLAFGAGPHRCSGSNLARMNLRIALRTIAERLHDLRLAIDTSEVHYHSVYNRGPLDVPITFTPGPRRG